MGSGRIFPIAEDRIAIEHRDIPPHWPRIGGMDFGWDHPFAAVELAWDRDTDTVYVTKAYRLKEATPVIHAAALRAWGKELRWGGLGMVAGKRWRVPALLLQNNTKSKD